jgi:hypothetical protein
VAYTHRLTDDDLADLHTVSSTAHQFQDWVQGKHHEARGSWSATAYSRSSSTPVRRRRG